MRKPRTWPNQQLCAEPAKRFDRRKKKVPKSVATIARLVFPRLTRRAASLVSPFCWEVVSHGLPEVDASLTISDGVPNGSHVKKPLCLLWSDGLTSKRGGITLPLSLGSRFWTQDSRLTVLHSA